jgi:serine/threonine-protein kinase RsbW
MNAHAGTSQSLGALGGRTTAEVSLRLPADGAFVLILRTAAAGLAARLDFPLDDIEDIRTAVDEASSMLLPQAVPGSQLACDFRLEADSLTVTLEAQSADPHEPDRDSFSWQVLSALTAEVTASTDADSVRLVLTARSSSSSGATGPVGLVTES